MFNRHPEASYGAVMGFVVGAEFAAPGLFAAQARLRVRLSEPLIAAVGDDPHVRAQVRVLLSEQRQVMAGATGVRGRQNLLTYNVDDDLTFEGVAFLFPAVVASLFF